MVTTKVKEDVLLDEGKWQKKRWSKFLTPLKNLFQKELKDTMWVEELWLRPSNEHINVINFVEEAPVEPTNPSLDLEHSEATEAENSPVVEISKQETPSVEETPSVLEEKMIQELIAKEKKLKEKEEREKAEKIIIEAGFRPLLENLPEDDKKRLVYKVILWRDVTGMIRQLNDKDKTGMSHVFEWAISDRNITETEFKNLLDFYSISSKYFYSFVNSIRKDIPEAYIKYAYDKFGHEIVNYLILRKNTPTQIFRELLENGFLSRDKKLDNWDSIYSHPNVPKELIIQEMIKAWEKGFDKYEELVASTIPETPLSILEWIFNNIMKRVSRNSDLDTTILDLKRLDLHCFEIEYKTIQNLTKNPSTSPSVLLKLLNSASEIDESSHLVLKGNCFLHDNLPWVLKSSAEAGNIHGLWIGTKYVVIKRLDGKIDIMIGANREEHKDLYIKYLEKFSNDLQDLEKDRRHFQDRYTEFLESHKDQFEGYILWGGYIYTGSDDNELRLANRSEGYGVPPLDVLPIMKAMFAMRGIKLLLQDSNYNRGSQFWKELIISSWHWH